MLQRNGVSFPVPAPMPVCVPDSSSKRKRNNNRARARTRARKKIVLSFSFLKNARERLERLPHAANRAEQAALGPASQARAQKR